MSRLALTLMALLLPIELHAEGPCAFGGGGSLGLGGDAPKPAPCDGGEIEIAQACHCRAERDQERPWGATGDLRLDMPKAVRVESGRSVSIPFTLRYQGSETITLDFSGGSVVYQTEIFKGKQPVDGPPCGVLGVLPDLVRLTLRPGATVRGSIGFRARNHPHPACDDMARDLRPGAYRVVFSTLSGEPALTASVAATVVPRKKRP